MDLKESDLANKGRLYNCLSEDRKIAGEMFFYGCEVPNTVSMIKFRIGRCLLLGLYEFFISPENRVVAACEIEDHLKTFSE